MNSSRKESQSPTENDDADQPEDLSEAVSHLLEECRMVLPGIQALFGFQWIAFLNQRFGDLPGTNQALHLGATAIVAVSAALLMTPAAYHRTVRSGAVSQDFISVSTRLILTGMFLLSVGIAIDFFVISSFIVVNSAIRCSLALMMWCALVALWFVFPMAASAMRGGK